MRLHLYLFRPAAMYSHGVLGVAAATAEDALAIAREHPDWPWDGYCAGPETDVEHVRGALVTGKPRVLFDYTSGE